MVFVCFVALDHAGASQVSEKIAAVATLMLLKILVRG
jgi:hypothetical protein